jgi:hypothetical protein
MLCDVFDALPLIHAPGAMRGRLMNCQSLRQQSTAIHCKAPQLKPLRAGYGVGAASGEVFFEAG